MDGKIRLIPRPKRSQWTAKLLNFNDALKQKNNPNLSEIFRNKKDRKMLLEQKLVQMDGKHLH